MSSFTSLNITEREIQSRIWKFSGFLNRNKSIFLCTFLFYSSKHVFDCHPCSICLCKHTHVHTHPCSNSFSFFAFHSPLIKRIVGPFKAGILPLVTWCWSNINYNLHLITDLPSGSSSLKTLTYTPLVQLKIWILLLFQTVLIW